jgi:hypothetical protein
MASKKTGKKKARKKGRTAAQKAATAKLVAMNKGKKKSSKKRSKKKGKKKSSKKSGKRRSSHKAYTGGAYVAHSRYKPSVGEQFAGEKGGQRFHGPMTPAQALAEANRANERLQRIIGKGHTKRKTSKKRSKSIQHHSSAHRSGKTSGVVTAASILKGAKSNSMKLYVCAGKKFTGCGGGRKGAHVVGHLRG